MPKCGQKTLFLFSPSKVAPYPLHCLVYRGCVSVSAFALLVGVSVCIMNSLVVLKIFAFTAGNKKYKSVIKKKRKKHNNIELLAKTKLNSIKVLISKTLIDSYIKYDEFVSVNNVLREYNEMKEEIKNPEMLWNILCKNNENILC